MKMRNIFSACFATLLMMSSVAVAQTSACGSFHRTRCIMEGSKEEVKDFQYNAQSRSGLFTQGSVSKMRCVVYRGMEYRMTVCLETDVLGENIQFKITDAATKKELFDSAKEENIKQFEFSCEQTKQLIIEVVVPSGEVKEEKGKPVGAACVGLLIEHKVSERQGFSQY
jgi:hypothetical protein